MNENKKKFRLMDAILAVICVVFVAEAAAPVAAIGIVFKANMFITIL